MKEQTLCLHYKTCDYDELTDVDRRLIDSAKAACSSAYAPYSKFQVGAAVLLANDEIICGSNQENAAYPSGICAERCAVFYANSRYPDRAVVALAIAASNTPGEFLSTPIAPCGACRQVMLEVEQRHRCPIRILLYGTEGIYLIEGGVSELLPLTFNDSFLE